MPIQYVVGDVTEPTGPGPKVVVHCCNDAGRFGAGVSGAIGRRFPEVERAYRSWCSEEYSTIELGMVQFVAVGDDLLVANLIGQHGVVGPKNPVPIDYWAIAVGLGKVARRCLSVNASLHMPRMGAGLAGGDWSKIATLVIWIVVAQNIPVTVYDLE
jgi:O-acetyl-ADP-ribose deacetylase (regulator of RNase III)